MGLSSAWKRGKGWVKQATGYNKFGDFVKHSLTPENILSGFSWSTLEQTPKVVQGWSNILGTTDIFQPDIDFPEQVAPAEILYPQQTESSDGGSNVNRRRRVNPYVTSGGALGDSTFATSGIRSKLG